MKVFVALSPIDCDAPARSAKREVPTTRDPVLYGLPR